MEQIKCPSQDTRHWKPGDIFTMECPKCGAEIELFKDDTRRRCAWCGHLFYNPKIELGCAEWCQYAEKCVPELVKEKQALQTFKELLAQRVKTELGGDPAASERLDRVVKCALDLLKAEGGHPKVVLAAVQLKPLGLDRAKAILAELETEPEIIEAVMELMESKAPAEDHSRQVYRTATAISATSSMTGRAIAAACAIASTRRPCDSSIGTTWRRKVTGRIWTR